MERSAKWIWPARRRDAVNCHVLARRAFTLPAKPSEAVLEITACDRYRLYVNGKRVGEGPPRSEWPEVYVDRYERDALKLKRGRNVLAVVCRNTGLAQHGQPPGPGGLLVSLVVKCGAKKLTVVSDGEWRMLEAPQYSRVAPRRMFPCGFTEVYDLRREPKRWTSAGFRDAAWPAADVVDKQPARPYGKAIPCPVPALVTEKVRPARVGKTGTGGRLSGVTGLPFEFCVFGATDDEFYGGTFVYSPRKQKVNLDFGADNRAAVFVNNYRVLCQADGESFYRNLFYEADSYTGLYWGHGIRVAREAVELEKGWNSVGVVIGAPHDTWGFVMRFSDAKTGRTLPLEFSPNRKKRDIRSWHVISDANLMNGADGMLLETPEVTGGTFPSASHLAAWEGRKPAAVEGAEALCEGGRGTLKLPPDGFVGYRMPAELVGCIELEVRGQAGAALDVTAGEALTRAGHVDSLRDRQFLTDRVILDGTWQKWRSLDRRAMRYIELAARNATEPIEVRALWVDAQHYPAPGAGRFESSDKVFNKLWDVSVATLDACVKEQFEDCPIREMAQWLGDVVVEGQVASVAWGDSALVAKALRQFGQDQKTDRWTRAMVPSGYGGMLTDYSLMYPYLLWRHHMHWGDEALLAECFAHVSRLMTFAEEFASGDGLLEKDDDPRTCVYLDHTVAKTHGGMELITGYQAVWATALERSAQLAEMVGQRAKAKRWRAMRERVGEKVQTLMWDREAGMFAESLTGGKPDGRITATTNYLVLFAGLATAEQEQAILKKLWPGATREAVSLWPPRENPYFKYWVLEVLLSRGLWQQAFAVLRQYYGAMLRHPDAWTLFEMYERESPRMQVKTNSMCHAYGAGPLVHYFRWICGIRPTEPGFASVVVEPQPGDLTRLEASLPTPRGEITMKMAKGKGGRVVEVALPAGVEADPRATYLGERGKVGGAGVEADLRTTYLGKRDRLVRVG